MKKGRRLTNDEIGLIKNRYSVMLQKQGSKAKAAKSNAVKGTKLEIDPKKFDYLYGKVNSGEHNTARSTQLSQMMRRLGLQTNESGTAILTEYFNKVVNTKGNVINKNLN